jgi:F0F1-type ATP synthase assembly protein I
MSVNKKPGKPFFKKSQLAKNCLKYQIAGVGFFFGFFTSLFLRCCPFAMIALLL